MTLQAFRTETDTMKDRDAFARHQARNLEPRIVKDLAAQIEAAGVEYIYYALPTIGSRVVAKMVPANHFRRNLEKGIAFHRTALSDLQNDRHGKLIGGGIEAREFWALPEPESFVVLPWDTSVARIFCTAYEPPHLPEVGGRPLAIDTRALPGAHPRGLHRTHRFRSSIGHRTRNDLGRPRTRGRQASRFQPRLPGREP